MPIAFLFGPGTSVAVSDTDGAALVPAVAELTTRCAAAATRGMLYEDACEAIVAALQKTVEETIQQASSRDEETS